MQRKNKNRVQRQHQKGREETSNKNGDDHGDEIKYMVRTMCNNAFQKLDSNCSTYNTHHQNQRRRGTPSLPGVQQRRIAESKPCSVHREGREKDIYICNNESSYNYESNQSPDGLQDFKQEQQPNINENFYQNCESQESIIFDNQIRWKNEKHHPAQMKDASAFILKQNIQLTVNQHLKKLETTEKEMGIKFNSAKKEIMYVIQTLQLHHDDLVKKENQYLVHLNQCRQSILLEAEEHYETEVQKLQRNK